MGQPSFVSIEFCPSVSAVKWLHRFRGVTCEIDLFNPSLLNDRSIGLDTAQTSARATKNSGPSAPGTGGRRDGTSAGQWTVRSSWAPVPRWGGWRAHGREMP
jgi:hypothetical protein